MNLEVYPYSATKNNLEYLFTSIGPRGPISKGVRFEKISPQIFNLVFGDLNKVTGEICDNTVTDNKDTQKVLSTVASIVGYFSYEYPKYNIIARGSSPSRNRLYRRGITTNLLSIAPLFDVFAYKDGIWEQFKPARNYDIFMVKRKPNT